MTGKAVLGFRPHTYWTAVVALTGDRQAPQVVERRKLMFAEGYERFIFHQAAEGDRTAAAGLIERTREAVHAKAVAGLVGLLQDLERDGLKPAVAATSASTSKHPQALEAIFDSHSWIHAAEGNFYRDIVAAGCEEVGLTVRRVAEKEASGLLCAALHVEPPELEARLQGMGAALGPPWTVDQRLATTMAWLEL